MTGYIVLFLALLFVLFLAWLLGGFILSRAGWKKPAVGVEKLKRNAAALCLGAVSFCGLGIVFHYGNDYWRVFDFYSTNFAINFADIHRLQGDEASWMGYAAWISFSYDGAFALKHPENYKKIP